MKNITNTQVFEFLFALVLGASFIVGGMNIALTAIMGAASMIAIFKGVQPSNTRANIYFAGICLLYFCYFVSRAIANNIDAGTASVFIENIPFLLAPLAIPMITLISPDRILKFAANWLFPFSIVLLIAAVIERYGMHVARVDLTSRSPLILTVLIISSVHLALFEWRERGMQWKITAVISWVIGLIVIGVFAQSRASIGGHFLGASIVISYLIWDAKRTWLVNLTRQVVAGFGAVVLFAVLVLIIYKLNLVPRLNLNIDYFMNGGAQEMDYSSASRVFMWKLGLAQFWNAPFFGVGPQNTFHAIAANWPYDTRHGHLHSDFLNHLVGGGLVGISIYFLLVFSPIVFIFANRVVDKKAIYICLFVVATIIFSGLTARVFFRPVLIHWAVYLLLFSLVVSEKYNRRKSTTD